MAKFLIEGSCDGGLFAETIEAESQPEAEALAVKRLCEAWGEKYGPETTLDDLGDCAMVTPYSAEDYARDAAALALPLYRQLADGLSEMIEGGRLQECSIPDDYRWLVELLVKVAAADPSEPIGETEPPIALARED